MPRSFLNPPDRPGVCETASRQCERQTAATPHLCKGRFSIAPAEGRSRPPTAVNRRMSRQAHGVGSPKSCKTKKGDLRREENATAVGGDRGTDRPAPRRRGRREPQRVAL